MTLNNEQLIKLKPKQIVRKVQYLVEKCSEDSSLVKDIVYYLYNTDSQLATEIRDELNYWIENESNENN